MNKDFLDFYGRWLKKAQSYNSKNLTECFDKFVTLFILYNFQYNSLVNGNNANMRDKEKATRYIKQFIDVQSFCDNKVIEKESQKIIKLIDREVFCIKNKETDAELVQKMTSNSEDKIEGILEIIYYIRCNLFHGQKSFTYDQKGILIPCIAILEEINKILFESVKKQS